MKANHCWREPGESLSQLTSKLGKPAEGEERLGAQAKAAVQLKADAGFASGRCAGQRSACLEIHGPDGSGGQSDTGAIAQPASDHHAVDAQAASLWGVDCRRSHRTGADLMAGGLTLGAGALVGALLYFRHLWGAVWGANKMFDQEQQSQLSTDYLERSSGSGIASSTR